MFGIGFWEFVLITVLVLLFLGPERIGPIMRTIGKIMREIQKGAIEVRQALKIDDELERIEEIKKTIVHDVITQQEEVERISKNSEETKDNDGEKKRWDELHNDNTIDSEGVKEKLAVTKEGSNEQK